MLGYVTSGSMLLLVFVSRGCVISGAHPRGCHVLVRRRNAIVVQFIVLGGPGASILRELEGWQRALVTLGALHGLKTVVPLVERRIGVVVVVVHYFAIFVGAEAGRLLGKSQPWRLLNIDPRLLIEHEDLLGRAHVNPVLLDLLLRRAAILVQDVRGRVAAVGQASRRLQIHAFEAALGLQLRYRLLCLVDLLVDEVHLALHLVGHGAILRREHSRHGQVQLLYRVGGLDHADAGRLLIPVLDQRF